MVTQLLQCFGLGRAGLGIVGFSEQQLVAQLRSPTVLTLVQRGLHFTQHRLAAAHGLDGHARAFNRRQRVEVGRVAIVETHVALVHGA
ncbi:hypothetical protein D3C84_1084730 [compost metagenome]